MWLDLILAKKSLFVVSRKALMPQGMWLSCGDRLKPFDVLESRVQHTQQKFGSSTCSS